MVHGCGNPRKLTRTELAISFNRTLAMNRTWTKLVVLFPNLLFYFSTRDWRQSYEASRVSLLWASYCSEEEMCMAVYQSQSEHASLLAHVCRVDSCCRWRERFAGTLKPELFSVWCCLLNNLHWSWEVLLVFDTSKEATVGDYNSSPVLLLRPSLDLYFWLKHLLVPSDNCSVSM